MYRSLLLLPFISCCALSAQPIFTPLPSTKTQISFKNTLTETVDLNIISYEYFYNGGGVAAGDLNNDGWVDLYFTGNMVQNKLYLNKGHFVFEDITKSAGVAGRSGWKTGVTMADVNGDGWLDLYVCYSGRDSLKRANQLFINQRNNTFIDEAKKYGVASTANSTQAAFFDYDLDGDLDLYLLNHNIHFLRRFDASVMKNQRDRNAGDQLLKNENGVFRDVSVEAGIKANPIGFGLGVAVADFNHDGWPDVYVSNDYLEQDYCYLNNGNGTFTDGLETMMGHVPQFSMGSDAADFNNDGFTDLVALDMLPPDNYRRKLFFVPDNYETYREMLKNGFYHQLMRNMLQLNNGDGTFSEIGQFAGVSATDWSWAALFGDLDNDGWKDLMVTNGYLRDVINMDFTKFYADERLRAAGGGRNEKILEMIRQVPTTPLANFLFRNNADLTFTDQSAEWGLTEKGFTNGAVQADLDNDGDLDLVFNRINAPALVCENTKTNSGFLQFSFSNLKSANRFGIGVRVMVFQEGKKQYQEFFPTRGFQSAMHLPLHFGLGGKTVDSVLLIWPDGKQQVLRNLVSNQRITVNYEEAAERWIVPRIKTSGGFFEPVSSPLKFSHEEDPYNDFKQQPLMPNMISFSGPRCARGDVNGDGFDDLYVCGAKNKAGKLFLGSAGGNFTEIRQKDFERDVAKYDADAALFDADGDGDRDLYVVSGGYQFATNDTLLQDRFYRNESGVFKRDRNVLPAETASGACVKPADIDSDGDLDLFIGGRVVPGRYPETPRSFILVNDGKGNFADATPAIHPGLETLGMVTDAAWLDLNNDQKPDLIVAGEWMPIKVFLNRNGKLDDASSQYIPPHSTGWWNRILADDFDGDGDVDLVVGNCGKNFHLTASAEKPLLLRYADFDQNGSIDPLLFSYTGDSLWPLATRDEMLDQLISLRKKFTSYDLYARARPDELLTVGQQQQASLLQAGRLETSYLENKGNHFEWKSLPAQAQFSPVFALASVDADLDGHQDLVLCGNAQHVRIRFGKADANYGMLFKGDGKGNFNYVPQAESGLRIRGDVRDILPLENPQGTMLLFAINQQPVQAYRFRR